MENTEITLDTPVTYHIGSDSYGGRVTGHSASLKTVHVRLNHRTDEVMTFTLRKGGVYREKGSDVGYLRIGEAVDYRDPCK